MKNTLAVIMAAGQSAPLSLLSQSRPPSAVPFGGKYRVIDFALSNCANSGILNVGILTQYQHHSLNDHIRAGEPWDLDRKLSGGVTLLPPYQRNGGSSDWYHGTADAVYQNLDFVRRHQTDTTLVLSGDHIYKMDYRPLLRFHQQHQADVTLCTIKRPIQEALRLNSVVIDEQGRAIEFPGQPPASTSPWVLMDIYIFRTEVLIRQLTQDALNLGSSHDFDRDILPSMLERGDRLYVYRFEDHWADIRSVQAYWKANMDLLLMNPPLNLQDRDWRIRTRSEERPPVSVCAGADISNSLVTNGCVVRGRVVDSVLFPGVRVEAGATVRNAILLNDCVVGPMATVDRAVLDKNVVVGPASHIGFDLDDRPAQRYFAQKGDGLTLIGKNTRLPARLRVGRACVIDSEYTKQDLEAGLVINTRYTDFHPAGNLAFAPHHDLVAVPAFG